MGIEWILGGLAALATVLAGCFKVRGDRERSERKRAEDRARRNAKTASVQAKAAIGLERELRRQKEERQAPDVAERDDLEGRW